MGGGREGQNRTTMYPSATGGEAGVGESARRRNLRSWVQVLAVACLALPVHFRLAEGKPSVTVTIVARETIWGGGEAQNGGTLNETAVAAKPAGGGEPPSLFSPEWEKVYSSGRIGCHLGRKRYVWRPCGFGSNIVREFVSS